MNAVILCVGKLKEKWQADGCAEYLKRLSRYGKYEVVAVDDARAVSYTHLTLPTNSRV